MTAAEPTPVLPGTRTGDAALAAGVFCMALLEALAQLLAPTPPMQVAVTGPAGVAVGVLFAAAQAALVLIRRQRPRTAFALLPVVAVVMFPTIGGFASYTWPVLAFAVARAPGRALPALVLPVLGGLAGAALLGSGQPPDLPTRLGLATGLGVSVGVLVLIGALAGRYSRYAARRAGEQRRADERTRHAAALRTERARIAEEIGSGVLAGLRRLVELAASPDPDLRVLRDQARTVLAAMRRVLGVLRDPAGDTTTPAEDAEPVPRRRRWPLPDQAGLVALAGFLVLALPLAALPTAETGQPEYDQLLAGLHLPLGSPVALLAVATQFAMIAWWRTAPIPALLVATSGSLVSAWYGTTNLVAEISWMLIVWGAATRAPIRVSAPVVAVCEGVVLAVSLRTLPFEQPVERAALVLSFLWATTIWVTGVLVGRHRAATERRERERTDADARDAVAGERLRVARDLHDVVAHHVSAIAVQAGAARLASDPADRAEALGHIAESGRRVAAALPELAGLTPDPHGVVLDDDGVAALVAPSVTAGLPVTATVGGAPHVPSGDAELFAQRILTESLTNVLRHAGPTSTRVEVAHTDDTVSVEVTDDGPVPGHRPDGHGSGLGLVGMRERAALLGGSLETGPSGDGGWRVRATLPRGPLVRADEAAPAPISSSTPIREDPPAP